jgi:hypothetical protein
VRAWTIYFWAIAGLVATAGGLTAVRGSRDLLVFLLGVLALAGRLARRHPRARPWRAWPGHGLHILAMTGSYTVMWIAFLVDNARFLPLTDRLPTPASVALPAFILAARSNARAPARRERRLS